MATNYPASLDALPNPAATDYLGTAAGVGVAALITNLNDAVEAMQVKIGVDGSAVSTTLDYLVKNTNANNVTFSGNLTFSGDPTFSGAPVFSGAFTSTGLPVFSNASGLKTDVITERSAANGITVDGLNIKDGALNTNNSVVEANITDGVVGVAKLKSEEWTDYDPTWTALVVDPTVGNATIQGRYIKQGRKVTLNFLLVFGATSAAGTGEWRFSIPFDSYSHSGAYGTYGTAWCYDTSVGTRYAGVAEIPNGSQYVIASFDAQTASTGTGVPITWATGDQFGINITYESTS